MHRLSQHEGWPEKHRGAASHLRVSAWVPISWEGRGLKGDYRYQLSEQTTASQEMQVVSPVDTRDLYLDFPSS